MEALEVNATFINSTPIAQQSFAHQTCTLFGFNDIAIRAGAGIDENHSDFLRNCRHHAINFQFVESIL